MASDLCELDRQAQKCVNEFVERADGNWKRAKGLWCEELEWLPYNWKYKRYVKAVFRAFAELGPQATGKP
jgi:hypothetical protein